MRSILVSGCNRGIGLGLVRFITRQQNPPQHIFATCRNIDKAVELRDVVDQNPNVQIHLIELDVRDTETISGAVDYVRKTVGDSGLNVLFNNAGTGGRAVRLSSTKELDVLDSFRVNASAPLMMTKAFLPMLKIAAKQNDTLEPGLSRACVINMSSILGSIGSNDDGANYAYRMSKAALNAATKSMSIEFRALGILAISLHPGWIRTDMGGSNAPLSLDETLPQLWTTLQSLNERHNGAFLDYRGERLAW